MLNTETKFPPGLIFRADKSINSEVWWTYFLVLSVKKSEKSWKMTTFYALAKEDFNKKRFIHTGQSGVLTRTIPNPDELWSRVLESRMRNIFEDGIQKVTNEFDFFQGEAYLRVLQEARRRGLEPIYIAPVTQKTKLGNGAVSVKTLRRPALIIHQQSKV